MFFVSMIQCQPNATRTDTRVPYRTFFRSVVETLKHLSGHCQPESGTNGGPAPLSERELRENFFPPFEEVIRRTGVAAVMPSYNEIDGVPSHANKWLLTDVLRCEIGRAHV